MLDSLFKVVPQKILSSQPQEIWDMTSIPCFIFYLPLKYRYLHRILNFRPLYKSSSLRYSWSDPDAEPQQRGRAVQPGVQPRGQGQADQPAAGAEGPRREGLQGGEGAARAGAGRVQNENSHLRVGGGSRGLAASSVTNTSCGCWQRLCFCHLFQSWLLLIEATLHGIFKLLRWRFYA